MKPSYDRFDIRTFNHHSMFDQNMFIEHHVCDKNEMIDSLLKNDMKFFWTNATFT